MKKRAKELKGFILGLIVATVLTGTFVLANTEMRELIFGVGVSLDGQVIDFEDDMRPFVIQFPDGGRTFLPVRAIADLVGLDIDFNAATNTVLLTTPDEPAGPVVPAVETTRLADTFFAGDTSGGSISRVEASVSIMGTTHTNVLRYAGGHASSTAATEHNLGGNYTRLTGVFGRVDGTPAARNATVRITGDGVTLHEFTLGMNDAPINVDVDVTGVNLLIVTVTRGPFVSGAPSGTPHWAFSADLR